MINHNPPDPVTDKFKLVLAAVVIFVFILLLPTLLSHFSEVQ